MKLPKLLLVGSLAVNAAVLALYFSKNSGSSPGENPPSGAVGVNDKTPGGPKSSPKADAAQAARLTEAWTQLQSGDLTTLAARLRAAGFSSSMIRAIVAAQVSEQFNSRRKALLAAQEERPYWKNTMGSFLDPKTQAALRELGKEQSALMKSLLGADALAASDDMQAFYQSRQFGSLPREKIERVQGIASDYSELTQEIYAKTNGLVMLAEDREKLAFLEKEKIADLAKVLTPQELEDYQLRNSNTASQLRYSLSTFNASEDEFRAIYRASTAVEAQLGVPGNYRTMEDMRKRQDALAAQLQTTLSPERLAEFKQSTDPQYQQINRLVARLELPATTSQQVVAVQTDIQNRARALQTNRDLAPEARNAQLTALQQEATTKLTTALTPRGLEAYKQNGGFWLENLKPRPAPAAVARPGGG